MSVFLRKNSCKTGIEVKTFAKWARENLGEPAIYDREAGDVLNHYACVFPDLDTNYLIKEVDYLLGRFEYDSSKIMLLQSVPVGVHYQESMPV